MCTTATIYLPILNKTTAQKTTMWTHRKRFPDCPGKINIWRQQKGKNFACFTWTLPGIAIWQYVSNLVFYTQSIRVKWSGKGVLTHLDVVLQEAWLWLCLGHQSLEALDNEDVLGQEVGEVFLSLGQRAHVAVGGAAGTEARRPGVVLQGVNDLLILPVRQDVYT